MTGSSLFHGKLNPLGRHLNRKAVKVNKDLKGKYTYKEWTEQRDLLMDTIGDMFATTPSGIVLDGIGYFSMPAFTKAAKRPYTNKSTILSNGLLYYPQSYCMVFNNALISPLSFLPSRKVKKHVNKLIDEGMNYNCYLSQVSKTTGRRKKYVYDPR